MERDNFYMSDPAFSQPVDTDSFMQIADLPKDPDAIYLFDFDGVIASGLEDQIYKLDAKPGEIERFEEIEKALGFRFSGLEHRYRRHLVFQELALRQQLPINRGTGFERAAWAAENARFFILTARSGWAATDRVRTFLEQNNMNPIDLYQVGRVLKDRQVLRTVEEFPDARVYYIEDSAAHLARAEALQESNLALVYCDPAVETQKAMKLYDQVIQTGIEYVREKTR